MAGVGRGLTGPDRGAVAQAEAHAVAGVERGLKGPAMGAVAQAEAHAVAGVRRGLQGPDRAPLEGSWGVHMGV